MDDLKEPEASEELEFDLALAYLALKDDHLAKDDWEEHKENSEEDGREDTLDDANDD